MLLSATVYRSSMMGHHHGKEIIAVDERTHSITLLLGSANIGKKGYGTNAGKEKNPVYSSESGGIITHHLASKAGQAALLELDTAFRTVQAGGYVLDNTEHSFKASFRVDESKEAQATAAKAESNKRYDPDVVAKYSSSCAELVDRSDLPGPRQMTSFESSGQDATWNSFRQHPTTGIAYRADLEKLSAGLETFTICYKCGQSVFVISLQGGDDS